MWNYVGVCVNVLFLCVSVCVCVSDVDLRLNICGFQENWHNRVVASCCCCTKNPHKETLPTSHSLNLDFNVLGSDSNSFSNQATNVESWIFQFAVKNNNPVDSTGHISETSRILRGADRRAASEARCSAPGGWPQSDALGWIFGFLRIYQKLKLRTFWLADSFLLKLNVRMFHT